MKKSWFFLILVLITSFLVPVACIGKAITSSFNPADLLVSDQRIQDDIRYIAVNFPNRLAGSRMEQDTVRYIRERLEQLGLETAEQEFPIQRYEYSEPSFVWWESIQAVPAASGNGKPGQDRIEMAVRPFLYSPPAEAGGTEGELVDCHLGRSSDWAGIDAKGKIALLRRGDITFTEKAMNAQKAGAIAALMYNNADDSMIGTLVQPVSIPVLGLSGLDGTDLVEYLSMGRRIEARLELESAIVPGTSINISGTIPSADGTRDYIIIGAHLDSVDTPGANDNASGIAALMELARIIAANPVKKEIQVIAFGAEEIGLRGSMAAARTMQRSGGNCLGMVNLDSVGTGQMLKVYSAPGGDDSLVKLVTTLASQSGIAYEADHSPYSDHTAFAQAGIPAVFLMREPASTVHTRFDIPDSIEAEGIKQIVELVYQLLLEL